MAQYVSDTLNASADKLLLMQLIKFGGHSAISGRYAQNYQTQKIEYMGMIGNLIRVSNDELDQFKLNSELLENKVYADDSYDQEWYMDLDKSWEAIHYLMNGKSVAETEMEESDPTVLGRLLFNEQLIDEEQDLGYGPAFYLTSEQVSETNDELQKIESDELESKYNGTEMNQKGIYPEIWNEPESKEFVFESFNDLREFYKKAAESNEAIITFIN